MSQHKKQSFLQGALILAFGAILVKIIGVIFKIPLIRLIGSSGLGYFNTAYDLYLPIYTLAVAGLPVAVAKMVAESAAKKQYKDIKKIYQTALRAFLLTGTIGFLIMVGGASVFVKFIRNPGAFYSILALSPMIFFSCMISAHRGYYEGLCNMYPTAVSQIIEAVSKLVLGLGLAYVVVYFGNDYYELHGTVFGLVAQNPDDAKRLIFSLGAAGAISGVTIGSVLATVYLAIYHKKNKNIISKEEYDNSPPARHYKEIIKTLVKIAIPVCFGALVLNITALVDVTLLQRRIGDIVRNYPDFINTYYPNTELVKLPGSEIANSFYGYYGYALILYAIIPTITQAFGVSALPTVTTAWTKNDKKHLKASMESALKITALIAFPSGLSLAVLSKPILNLLYGGDALGITIAAPLLTVLGISVIFLSFSSPINSMLQAIGKQNIPVILLIIGGLIKILTNYILVGIPSININGAPIGTLCCCVFVAVLGFIMLCIKTKILPNFLGVFVKPLAASGVCAVSGWVCNSLLAQLMSEKLSVLIAIVIAVIAYVIALLCLRTLTSDEIKMLPFGENLHKLLEKYSFIG